METSALNPPQRVLRVFVSSTFRDMRAERDELAKFIFPQLRKLCEQRGVVWGEVDLRWGITDEQAEEGKVLPICLGAIQRCSYFIGMLGERYGWIPREVPPELAASEGGSADHQENSVTEIEIVRGVLEDSRMAHHASFYFRDPAYVASLPSAQRAEFRETPSDEEIENFGRGLAFKCAKTRRQKLLALKKRLRNSSFPVRENYKNPVELGQWVLRDLTAVIDQLYPKESQPDWFKREAAEHDAFAARKSQIYIGGRKYFERLTFHVNSDELPLVLCGDAGLGKSALLAKWARTYRDEHPDELVILHFIGATPTSADLDGMLRRLLAELKEHFHLPEEIPGNAYALRTAFSNWLSTAATRGRVILVLDALNQLEDRSGALELVWLPQSPPKGIRIFLSTLPGRTLEELQTRGWPTLTVAPLDHEECRQFIKQYLALFTMALNEKRTDHIAASPQTHNPLFLQLLLDELRLFGVRERLDERIRTYLQAPDVPSLYNMILERYEHDYDRARPGLVRQALSMLWAARRGLTEQELREILGTEGGPLQHDIWWPYYLALEPALATSSGMFTFNHIYLRDTVRDRYLADEPTQQAARLRLADYFDLLRYLSEHSVTELPWQLARAHASSRLYELLCDLQFLESLMLSDPYQAISCWKQLESTSSFNIKNAYSSVIDAPERNVLAAPAVASLLSETGHLVEAALIQKTLAGRFRKTGNTLRLRGTLENLAEVYYKQGKLDEAWTLREELRELYRRQTDKRGQAQNLISMADIQYLRGNYEASEQLTTEAGTTARDFATETITLASKARILYARGNFDEAMPLFQELERRYLAAGDPSGVALALGNQADILRHRGNFQTAMKSYKKAEALYEQHSNQDLLVAAWMGQAEILEKEKRLEEALHLYKKCEEIVRGLGNPSELALVLLSQARVTAWTGSPFDALKLAQEAESLISQHGLSGLRGRLESELGIINFLTRLMPTHSGEALPFSRRRMK